MNRRNQICCIVSVLALAAGPGQALHADDSAELLSPVITAHRAARESIRTLYAQFKIERVKPNPAVLGTGTYLRSPDGVRISVGTEGKSIDDTLVKSGETRVVHRTWAPDKKIQFTARLDSGSEMLGLRDIWQRLLLSTYGSDRQIVPLERFIESATGPVRASKSREGNGEIIAVTFTIGTGQQEQEVRLEFDSRVNYLVRKMVISAPGESNVAEITEFREAQPGVFVPLQCRVRTYEVTELKDDHIISISNVVVNAPVQADRLTLPAIPSGTVVTDRIHNTKYPVDGDWNRIGPVTPSPIAPVAPSSLPTGGFTAQSTSEPTATSHWIVYASAGVLLVAGLVWGVRRWLGRRSAAV
jgi:hypothetical protein